jgi:hypothetical protein
VEIADAARRTVSALRKFQLTMAVGDPDAGVAPRHLDIPPLVVDMDGGYGNAFNVARTTELYVGAGVAAAHLEELAVVRRDDVDRGGDVRVLNARCELGLVEKHRGEVGIRRVLRVHPLDGDDSPEPDGPEHPAEIHTRHPARSDLVMKHVPSDPQRGLRSHSPSLPNGARALRRPLA